ncbi:MAG: DUF2330 domain-containing protein [Oscillatoria sp. PMC 1051.18]|nr:DUF2330 domain-containing protein [Oscillatoria sp. PMC 1050.18]MEC5030255.1 DUF2330 domain-containing protein [Oscillatoria sp. PMC 1051.18]
MKLSRILTTFLVTIATLFSLALPAEAFCGFYVAKADTDLYNQASQVAIARNGDRTILTMANDYQGDVQDFALVVPVPVILTEDRVRVGDPKIMQRLDAFSAPRLVEYFDENPCNPRPDYLERAGTRGAPAPQAALEESEDSALGVTIEDSFSVGEYDILILSATESSGLETWLINNGYKIPPGAKELLQPYIRQDMKFFVAKVNLAEYKQAGYEFLRPLMMAYESPKFMLPIRLGMTNAKQDQDLIIYLLSPQGQTELTNYRTVQVPSNVEIPEFVKNEFGDFYKAMFQTVYEREGKKVAFLEYAWNMQTCDPCAAEPLSLEELQQAGVFWLQPGQRPNVFISRLHVRYTRDKFPEDLRFQNTANKQNFQGRYVIRHPYKGEMNCPAAEPYQQALQQRQEQEVQTLANLTRWDVQTIRDKANLSQVQTTPWWRNIWN